MNLVKNKELGLYPKYYVEKIIGVDEEGMSVTEPMIDWVYVLNPTADPGATVALRAYVDWARENGYHRLADDLEERLERYGA